MQNSISGVIPSLAIQAGTSKPRNELAVGALMPWAGKLWAVSYVAHNGHGSALFSLDTNLNMTRHPESVSGTFANRMVHSPSDSVIIGPYVIDAKGKVAIIKELEEYRLAGCSRHLTDPENKVYVLSMEGPFFEVDLNTLEAKEIANLSYELDVIPEKQSGWSGKAKENVNRNFAQPHFKACYTEHGKVFVANNTYQPDQFPEDNGGRLAEWDGSDWKIVRKLPFNEVTGRENFGGAIMATGWDHASSILMVYAENEWHEYRLPKGSQTYEHFWQAEWPRVREIEHERWMMDAGGIFYEMSGYVQEGKIWGVKPICSHIRVIPDYCTFAGMLVMGDNQVSPVGNRWTVGESQSNFWFGKVDDLWSWGKPTGWGGPWWKSEVKAGESSAPYLMTGFDKKALHIRTLDGGAVSVKVEIDFEGNQSWCEYTDVDAEKGYGYHVFPEGFSAHWVRLTPDRDCTVSAQLHYT